MALTTKHRTALHKFIMPYTADKNVLGIFLTGSAVHSTLDKNSDLDVHIVLKDADYRERGNVFFDGVEIEYFINPVKQIRAYFTNEHDKGRHTAHMFCNAIVLYEQGPVLKQLQKEATRELHSPSKKMSKISRELAQYFVDDLRKNLEDMYEKRDWFAFERIRAALLEECLKTFLMQHQVHRREKDKRLGQQLLSINKKYAKLFVEATTCDDRNSRYRSTLQVVRLTEKILGGKRPNAWKLRGPLVL